MLSRGAAFLEFLRCNKFSSRFQLLLISKGFKTISLGRTTNLRIRCIISKPQLTCIQKITCQFQHEYSLTPKMASMMLVLYNFLVGAAEPLQPQFKLSLMLHMKLYLSLHTTTYHNWSLVSSSNFVC